MACWVAAGTTFAQTGAGAADWPHKPVRFIVPFPAGGSTDTEARVVGQLLGARLGQSFVIENRVGASGTIGTEAVARAAPDGYTIGLATTTTHALAASLSRALPYDPVKDFAPVSMLGSSPFVLVITPGLPAQSLRDFIALAKSKPGALTYGSAGAASIAHLATVLFANMAQVSLTHVPYKAGGTRDRHHDRAHRHAARHRCRRWRCCAPARARDRERATARRCCPMSRPSRRPACPATRPRCGWRSWRPPARRPAS